MGRHRKPFYILIIGFLLVLVLLTYFRVRENSKEAARRPAAILTVEVSTPQRSQIVRSLYFTGDILPIQQATIFSKVSGNLEKVLVDIGDYVKQGQLLALIDTTIYAQNARQAQGIHMQAQATLQNARMNFERNESLLGQNLIAKQDLDNARTAYEIAQAQVEGAQASYRNTLTQLSYCKVSAPFSGYITKRFLDAGAYVSASAGASSSTIFTIMDIDKVKILVNVLEKDIPALERIREAVVKTDVYLNRAFNARIQRISQAIDVATRTMPIEVDIENRQHLLKPGMFANINLVLQKKENALVLPSQVILKDDSGSYVFTVSQDSVAHKRYIELGIQQDNLYETLSGLSDIENVVFVGQTLIRDGNKVRIGR